MYTNAGMALASSLRAQSCTHTDHSLNKLIYLFQLFDKCIIPQTLWNHFKRIISFMMWKDYPECAGQSLYSETVQEVRRSQRLEKEGLIDQKGIFFVAAPLAGFFFFLFSSIKKMASPRFASLLTLLCLTLNNRNFRIYTFLKIRSHNFPVKWQEGRVEPGNYLQSVLVRLILNWQCGESGSAQFPSGFHEWQQGLALAKNWQSCSHLTWLCWAGHWCDSMAERGK